MSRSEPKVLRRPSRLFSYVAANGIFRVADDYCSLFCNSFLLSEEFSKTY